MTKKDGLEIKKIVAEAISEAIVPVLEKIDTKTDKMEKDIEEIRKEMATKGDFDRLERKYNAVQDRLDNHGKRIEKLEETPQIAS